MEKTRKEGGLLNFQHVLNIQQICAAVKHHVRTFGRRWDAPCGRMVAGIPKAAEIPEKRTDTPHTESTESTESARAYPLAGCAIDNAKHAHASSAPRPGNRAEEAGSGRGPSAFLGGGHHVDRSATPPAERITPCASVPTSPLAMRIGYGRETDWDSADAEGHGAEGRGCEPYAPARGRDTIASA